MTKNKLWFRHDHGARNDPKMLKVLRKVGAVGKAVFWDLLEMLNEEGGYLPIDSIEDVTFNNHLQSNEIAKYVVYESGLFEYDEEKFWSPRQLREQEEYNSIVESKKKAGRNSALARQNKNVVESSVQQKSDKEITDAQQMLNRCLTGVQPIDKDKDKHKDNNLSSKEDISETSVSEASNASGDKLFIPDVQAAQNQSKAGLLTNEQCAEVIVFWNRCIEETKATYPKVQKMTEARRIKIKVRWKEFAQLGKPEEVCKMIFQKACASSFMLQSSWASFDWLFTNDKNWVKVYEGNYDNRGPVAGPQNFSQKTDRSGAVIKVNDYWEGNDFSDVIENE